MARKKHKDWFDRDCALRLGHAIRENHSAFDVESYADEVAAGVPPLELKARVLLMAEGLRTRLPENYEAAAAILSASLGPPLEGETGMFTEGYWLMPVARFVEEYGHDHFDLSLSLCTEITRRHTSEYAVRPYIKADPERALATMTSWVQSNDLHIRRLASEGVRPRLPWAKRLHVFIKDPDPILTLITPLRADPSRYVRMSVANLINDVSKDHPDRIETLAESWSVEDNTHTDWIIQHGLRTLRKGRGG
ncbi:DNA alkylation repair protein [Aliiroseovarius sp. YM-037]|uniref:DNA alkylation repair protein n=1 Tax=Aliiroseovarius sp. YM-037 TaxID=3341728 RepID=UPI003A7FC04F